MTPEEYYCEIASRLLESQKDPLFQGFRDGKRKSGELILEKFKEVRYRAEDFHCQECGFNLEDLERIIREVCGE